MRSAEKPLGEQLAASEEEADGRKRALRVAQAKARTAEVRAEVATVPVLWHEHPVDAASQRLSVWT